MNKKTVIKKFIVRHKRTAITAACAVIMILIACAAAALTPKAMLSTNTLLFWAHPFIAAFALVVFWLCLRYLIRIITSAVGKAIVGSTVSTVMPTVLTLAYVYFVAVYRGEGNTVIWSWQRLLLHLSVVILCVFMAEGFILGLKSNKENHFFTFAKSAPTAIFVSGALLLFSVYYFGESGEDYSHVNGHILPALFNALQHTMRLFALDGDLISTVNQMISGWSEELRNAYVCYASALYLLAPFCTFGFVLNFVKNLFGTFHYRIAFFQTTHVFSELNAKTYSIAHSIVKKYADEPLWKKLPILNLFHRPLIVFTDITTDKEEEYMELLELARRDGAILLHKDLNSVTLFPGSRKHCIYVLSYENEHEKLSHVSNVVEKYNHKNVTLYLFSDSDLTKSYLDSYSDSEKKKLRLNLIRINDIRMLIYHELSEKGYRLFEKAVDVNGTKTVNAVIVGLGRYGIEMLKALMWFCQLPGYGVNVTVIDENENAIKRAKSTFSGIFDTENAEFNKDGDMKCRITHKVCAVGTDEYYKVFNANVSFVFICLGSDELNLSTARDTRRVMHSAIGISPESTDILTVIYDSELAERIKYDVNSESNADSSMSKFRIQVIGDIDHFYSLDTVLNSDINQNGYRAHRRWDHGANSKTNYYLDDYGMHSSIASALHKKLRSDILAKASDDLRKQLSGNPSVEFIYRHTSTCLQSDVLYRRAEGFVKYYSDAMAIAYHRLSGEQKSKIWSADGATDKTLDKDALLKTVLNTASERAKADAFAILDELYRKSSAEDPCADATLISAAAIEYLTLETVKAVKRVEDFISSSVSKYLNKKISAQGKSIYTEYEAMLETDALLDAIDGDRELNASHNNVPFRRWAYGTVVGQCLRMTTRKLPDEYRSRLEEEQSAYSHWTEVLAEISDNVRKLMGTNVLAHAYPTLVDSMTAFRKKNGGILPTSAEEELKILMDKYLERYGIEGVTYDEVITCALSIIDSAAAVEHIRWNAYMRSEGFVYAKKKNVPFKAHHNLVNLSALSISDKAKDV